MSVNIGSTGTLMVMVVIALWLWRSTGRPVKSSALTTALISIILAIVFEMFLPMVFKTEDGRGMVLFLVTACWGIGLGSFVTFILKTIGSSEKST